MIGLNVNKSLLHGLTSGLTSSLTAIYQICSCKCYKAVNKWSRVLKKAKRQSKCHAGEGFPLQPAVLINYF